MQLTKWDHFREMEDFFNQFGKSVGWPARGDRELMAYSDWAPRVDVIENEKEYIIKAEIPDVKKEDVKVTVESGNLTIKGERKQEKEEKNKKFHRVERHFGSFTRSFKLPDNVDDTKIDATFKDGMLNLKIPKAEKSKPKEVEISIK
ncbi:Hsp20/alpha crystallin family protein [bacterium]|nr:Hsp20/alpha crystallin family protein [bacterium]